MEICFSFPFFSIRPCLFSFFYNYSNLPNLHRMYRKSKSSTCHRSNSRHRRHSKATGTMLFRMTLRLAQIFPWILLFFCVFYFPLYLYWEWILLRFFFLFVFSRLLVLFFFLLLMICICFFLKIAMRCGKWNVAENKCFFSIDFVKVFKALP